MEFEKDKVLEMYVGTSWNFFFICSCWSLYSVFVIKDGQIIMSINIKLASVFNESKNAKYG